MITILQRDLCSVWTGPQTYTCTIDMNLVGMVIITISEVTVAFLGGEIINLIQKHLMYLISFNVTLQLMQLLVSRFFQSKAFQVRMTMVLKNAFLVNGRLSQHLGCLQLYTYKTAGSISYIN